MAAWVIATDVQLSADDKMVESITVLIDNGEELTMRLGDEVEGAIWGPSRLLSHVGLGKCLGLKIGVTYVRTTDSLIATQRWE